MSGWRVESRRACRSWLLLLTWMTVPLLTACASSRVDAPDLPRRDATRDRRPRGPSERGLASWYGPNFHGRLTANGEVYDMYEISAAHKKLPFETLVHVENLQNGHTLEVRINDRGPFIRGRIIDLSYGAAQKLGMVEAGVVPVRLTVIRSGAKQPQYVQADLYRVQIGAFRDKANAKQLARELRSRFKNVEIRDDGLWNRVQIRRISDRSRAQGIVGELLAAGYDAFLSACSADQCP